MVRVKDNYSTQCLLVDTKNKHDASQTQNTRRVRDSFLFLLDHKLISFSEVCTAYVNQGKVKPMSKKASLVINPRTGQNLTKLTDVLAILAAAGWKTELAIKEYGGHSMQLAQDFSAGPNNLVIAYGGDGTLNQVVNGVMAANKSQRSAVGLIPGGTANVWAGEIGIPRDPVLAALSLVNSSERKVDIGRVTIDSLDIPQSTSETDSPKSQKKKSKKSSGSSTARHHFLLMAGLGIDAAIMSNVSKPLKYRIGPLAVGLSAAKELPSQHLFPIEISTTATDSENPVLWKGEAIQVVIGNTRRYADVAEMTPDAYIDDGILDVCVITAGDPLSTLEQITSLLLRRKPDNITAEYFHGAHLTIRVPASVPMQLDGSVVKLKDYLSKAEYGTLQESETSDDVQITYCFDVLPKALTIEVPRTYDDTLFVESSENDTPETSSEEQKSNGKTKSHAHVHHHHRRADDGETPSQQHTEAVEGHTADQETQSAHAEKGQSEKTTHTPLENEVIEKFVQTGRKVTVVGKVPDPACKNTYIVAGGSTKESTGEVRPVAVVVNSETTLFNREGEHLPLSSVKDMHEGMLIIVEGKKSKRGVIQATRLLM
jgi:YegS/Rv2252/BmrU family lipid kinase